MKKLFSINDSFKKLDYAQTLMCCQTVLHDDSIEKLLYYYTHIICLPLHSR